MLYSYSHIHSTVLPKSISRGATGSMIKKMIAITSETNRASMIIPPFLLKDIAMEQVLMGLAYTLNLFHHTIDSLDDYIAIY